jgi:hypothetical protein
MLVIFVPSQNGIVFLTPKALPDAAYKIFAGPGLITIGSSVTSQRIAVSITVHRYVYGQREHEKKPGEKIGSENNKR